MTNGINPFDAFPFDKKTLETLLMRGTIKEAAKKYFRRAAPLLHPDQGGAEFKEFGLEADAVFKDLNGAYQQIESASLAQVAIWVEMYLDDAHNVIRSLEGRVSQLEQTANLNWENLQDALAARGAAEVAAHRAEKELDETTLQRETFKSGYERAEGEAQRHQRAAENYRRRIEELEQKGGMTLPSAESIVWFRLEVAAAQCELGRCESAAEQCRTAGELITKCIGPTKDTLTLWLEYWNGRTYEGVGNIAAATQSYERALALNNTNEPSKERLKRLRNVWFVLEDAASEINNSRYDTACMHCTLAQRIISHAFTDGPAKDERLNWLYYWQGRAYEGKRDWSRAEAHYFAAVSIGNETAAEALKGLRHRKDTTI